MKERYRLLLEYGALVMAIMLPMLLPGFILTLDMVFTPTIAFPQELTSTTLLQIMLWLLHLIIPVDIIEKLLIFFILLCSGISMHYLIIEIRLRHFAPEYVKWGAYFAGIFYMVNPFIYARFMAGQWMVLLGYALMPIFMLALLRLIRRPGWRPALFLAFIMTAIMSVSLHSSGIMAAVIMASAVTVLLMQGFSRRRTLYYLVMAVAMAAIANSYWIIPSFTGGTVGVSLQQFNGEHFEAFSTAGQGIIGSVSEVIRLQGFWAESYGLFAMPKDIVPGWGLIIIGLWVLVILGAKAYWRRDRLTTLVIGGGALLAVIFAATPLLSWAARYIALVAGYREPHKFVVLVALAFAFFGAIGVMWVLTWLKRRYKNETISTGAIFGLLLLPIFITPTMLWGFAGQLQPRQYPADWREMDNYLQKTNPKAQTLFLPWHQYMSFEFTGRIIANPAEKYFSSSVIAGDNPEFMDISPTIPNRQKRQIGALLARQKIEQLPALGVQYILLAKEHDYKDYKYIAQHPVAERLHETKTLILYKLKGGKE